MSRNGTIAALRSSRTARWLAVSILVATPGAALWAVGSRSYFALDDFWQLREAQREGLTLLYLREPILQHFGPGDRFLFWVVERYFPLHYGAVLALVLVLFAGSALIFQASTDLLFGRRWATLALTFLFTSSLFWVSQFDWFASSASSVPGTFFTLLALYCYLRYVYRGGAVWLGLSVAAFCAALLFFMRPLLLLLYLLALRLLFLGSDGDIRPRAALRVVRKEIGVWLAYAVPFAAYLIVYYIHYWYPSPGKVTVVRALDFLQLAWVRSLFPGTLGFLPVQTLDATGITAVIVSQALLFGLVAMSIFAWRAAWRAWLFLLVLFVANALMSGLPRIGQFGLGIAYEQRYFLDLSWLIPLSIGLALLPLRKPSQAAAEPAPRRSFPFGSLSYATPAAAVLVVAALAVHALITWHSANQVLDTWPGSSTKAYFQHLNAGLDALERRGETPNLADVAMPGYVIGDWLAPFNWASNTLATLRRPLVFNRYSRQLWVPDDLGQIHRAVFDKLAGGPVTALVRSHTFDPGGAVREGPAYCVAAGRSARLAFTPRPGVSGPRFFVRLESRGAAVAGVTFDPKINPALSGKRTFVVRRAGTSTWVLNTQTLTRVTFALRAESRFCVSSVTVGTFVPAGPSLGG